MMSVPIHYVPEEMKQPPFSWHSQQIVKHVTAVQHEWLSEIKSSLAKMAHSSQSE